MVIDVNLSSLKKKLKYKHISSLKHFRNTTRMSEEEFWIILLHLFNSSISLFLLSSLVTCTLNSWFCSIYLICFPLLEKKEQRTYTSWDFTQRALGWGNSTITVQYLLISTLNIYVTKWKILCVKCVMAPVPSKHSVQYIVYVTDSWLPYNATI